MKLTEIAAPDFDLAMTLDSGQVFHWKEIGRGFVGTIGGCAVYVEQHGNILKGHNSREKLDGFKPSSFPQQMRVENMRRKSMVLRRFVIRTKLKPGRDAFGE